MPTSPSRRRSMVWASCKTSYECLRGPLVRGIGDWFAASRLSAGTGRSVTNWDLSQRFYQPMNRNPQQPKPAAE